MLTSLVFPHIEYCMVKGILSGGYCPDTTRTMWISARRFHESTYPLGTLFCFTAPCYQSSWCACGRCGNAAMQCAGVIPELSTGRIDPRVGSDRVGSRFCQILARRVLSAPCFKSIHYYFLVPESVWIFEYYIRMDCFSTIFDL